MKKILFIHSSLVLRHLSPRVYLLGLGSHWPILTSQQEVKVKGQHVYPHSHSHHHTFKLMATEPLLFQETMPSPLDLGSEH